MFLRFVTVAADLLAKTLTKNMKSFISIFIIMGSSGLVLGQNIYVDDTLEEQPTNCLTRSEFAADTDLQPNQFRCDAGPVRIIHTVPGELHIPPIYRGSCDGLSCNDPPCFARTRLWRSQRVLVYRIKRVSLSLGGCYQRTGFQTRHYYDHQKCGCKECKDIKNEALCNACGPCPSRGDHNSNCFWEPDGKCTCCSPVACTPPKIFSRTSCSCVCPSCCLPKVSQSDCSCVCPRCSPPKVLQSDCSCVCPPCRHPPKVSQSDCSCVCPSSCGWRKVPQSDCSCVCSHRYASTCTPPMSFDSTTCTCGCHKDRCPSGRLLNFATCICDQPRNLDYNWHPW